MSQSQEKTKNLWTDADIAFLVENYEKLGPTKISKSIPHTKPACIAKAQALGLTANRMSWTESEIAFLEESYGVLSPQEISEMVNHPAKSIITKAKELGLANKRQPWTEAETERLLELYNDEAQYSLATIASMMNRNRGRIRNEMRKLGLDTARTLPAPWSETEIAFLRANYGVMSDEEIGQALGRSATTVVNKAQKMKLLKGTGNRPWTEAENAKLEDMWGRFSPNAIAASIGRSLNSVIAHAQTLRLGGSIQNNPNVRLCDIIHAIYSDRSKTQYYRIQQKWLSMGLPIKRFKTLKRTNIMVQMDDFWKWAKEHRAQISFAALELYDLGPEPEWVAEKRAQDRNTEQKIEKTLHRDPWTPDEIQRLKDLCAHPKGYECWEIAEIMGRTQEAVRRRVQKENLTLRPKVKDAEIWDENALQTLANMIREMDSWTQIAQWSGIPEESCQYKAQSTYGTRDLPKLKRILGDRPWGEATVLLPIGEQKLAKSVKRSVQALVNVLATEAHRDQELNPQRAECQWWMVGSGCGRCEQGCDYCPDFKRLPIHYCDHCGEPFIAKSVEEKLCYSCASRKIKKRGGKPLRKQCKQRKTA